MGELIVWWLLKCDFDRFMETCNTDGCKGYLETLPNIVGDAFTSPELVAYTSDRVIVHQCIADLFELRHGPGVSAMRAKLQTEFPDSSIHDAVGIVIWRHDIDKVRHIGGVFQRLSTDLI